MENLEETVGELSQQKFDKLMVKFLLDEPFFSSITAHVRKTKNEDIPTAGVLAKDGVISLFWNPTYVSKLTKKRFFGLMKHECYHLIFKHVTARKQEPHILWNIATDLAINSIIPEDELPEGGLIPGKPLKMSKETVKEEFAERAQKISKFIESLPPMKSSEWYMEKLKEDPELQEECEGMFGGTGAGLDVHFDNEGLSESDRQMLEGKIKDIVKKSAQRAQNNNSWGSVSQAVKSQIVSSLSDTIDWKKTLQYFCGNKQKANKSRTYRKINRKYPYVHPGRKVRHTSNLAIYIDQSGSVGDDGISAFFSALNSLARNVSFSVYHFDTSVDEASAYSWKKGKKYRLPMRTLSGGTCFNCVEDHFRKNSSKFDGYIVMTDGCAPKPKSCISKRCWVLLPGYELQFPIERRDAVVKMAF
jgi:predicted metal-dependent peptidase